ncbi:hypothetical protein ACD631_21085 (plasmid) [Alteromonas macleodii]|nr:hypothetical protein [Alteromonas macleodii]USI30267.1 hypothetical protein NFG60_20935 [Alteromonas macleodii]
MWFIINKDNPPKFYTETGSLIEVQGIEWTNVIVTTERTFSSSQFFVKDSDQALSVLQNSHAQCFQLKKDAKKLATSLNNG